MESRPAMTVIAAPRAKPGLWRMAARASQRLLCALLVGKWPKVTREGKYYVGITLGVGFAAVNTGNNLLDLLLGMLLSLIVVSGVMSDLSLRGLTVRRRLPARAQVGRAHLVEIEVFNQKKRVPSYAIEVGDLRAGQPADKRCFFSRSVPLGAGRRVPWTPVRRGRDRHPGLGSRHAFPSGFLRSPGRWRPRASSSSTAVDPLRLPPQDPGRQAGGGAFNGRGSGDETFALRPMREGDDPRDIYWRKSTRLEQHVIRERGRETRPEVELFVDTIRPHTALKPPDSELFSQQFERKIREIASRAVAHIRRGDSVTILTTAGERARGDNNVGADSILRALALLAWVDEGSAAPDLVPHGAPAASPVCGFPRTPEAPLPTRPSLRSAT